MITFIWAQDKKGAIGKDGTLPWHLPNDMKFFKTMTTGHTVVMGRKTFESMNSRPLPNRRNIIITRQKDYQVKNAEVIHSPEELNDFIDNNEDIYIIGGSEIYRLFLPYAQSLWQTEIEHDFEGDTFFPEVNWKEWSLEKEYKGMVDKNNLYAHTFKNYRRINKTKEI